MKYPGVNGACKGLCSRFYPTSLGYHGTHSRQLLAEGWRKCNKCEIFFCASDLYCKCCGKKTSTKPRQGKSRLEMKREQDREWWSKHKVAENAKRRERRKK